MRLMQIMLALFNAILHNTPTPTKGVTLMNQDIVVPSSTMIELSKIIAEQSLKIRHLEHINNMLHQKLSEKDKDESD